MYLSFSSYSIQKQKDEEFEAKEENDSDVEETIEEQEEHEEADHGQELEDLKDEGKNVGWGWSIDCLHKCSIQILYPVVILHSLRRSKL